MSCVMKTRRRRHWQKFWLLAAGVLYPLLAPPCEVHAQNGAPLPGSSSTGISDDLDVLLARPTTVQDQQPANSSVSTSRPSSRPSSDLQGRISQRSVDEDLGNRLNSLISSSLRTASENDRLDKTVARYNTRTERSKFGVKDLTLNYFGFPRGFDASIEGAQLVLDQSNGIKNLQAAEYWQQHRLDTVHAAVVNAMMQMATGLGCSNNTESQQQISTGLAGLEKLVGPGEAKDTLSMLVAWQREVKVPDAVYEQPVWDVSTLQRKSALAAQLALTNDFSMIALRDKLFSISDKSKGLRTTAKVVEGTVSLFTVFGPGPASPIIAQTAGAAWGVANGGSEESKLLKELYFEKQLQSRKDVIKEEAQLALMNYREAIRTKNAPLVLCSEAVLAQLVGAVGINQLLEAQAINHRSFVSRQMQATAADAPL